MSLVVEFGGMALLPAGTVIVIAGRYSPARRGTVRGMHH
jgi:hypothetical protein